jgi:glycosyltransferase involved in cell wall biosynthesis
MLERELAIYQRLPDEVTDIGIMSYGGRSESRFDTGDARIHVLKNWFGLPPRLRSAWMAYFHQKILRSADLYKTNQLSGAEAAIKAKKLWGKPLIVRAGNIWSQAAEKAFGAGSPELSYAKASETNSFKFADRIMVTDNGKAEFISREYGISKDIIRIIPNYVDTQLFSPVDTSNLADSATSDKPVITFVGRLSHPKRPELLIEAVSSLDVRVNIIGSGPFQEGLEDMAKNARADIRFLGNVTTSEVASYLQSSTLFSMPTVLEGQPKAILEAMSVGLPVVVSSAPGVTEFVEQGSTGVLADNDVEAFREAIVWLIENPNKRTEIGTRARNYVMENNALDSVMTDEMNVYRELAK